MIKSFGCKDTESLYAGGNPPKFSAFRSQAERKLQMLDAAEDISDLRSPPGNRLEKLSGNRLGQWSIRINDQWRICFEWQNNAVWNVTIVNYH